MNPALYLFFWRRYFKLNILLAKLEKEYEGYLEEIRLIHSNSISSDSFQIEDVLMGQAYEIDRRIAFVSKALNKTCNELGFNNKNIILSN